MPQWRWRLIIRASNAKWDVYKNDNNILHLLEFLIKVSMDQSDWNIYLEDVSSFQFIYSDTVELFVIHRNVAIEC